MTRDLWFDLKFFDKGLNDWGGDQVEITHKAFRCAGGIWVEPCSRVGHVFRAVKDRPYDVAVSTVVDNYATLATLLVQRQASTNVLEGETRDAREIGPKRSAG